MGSAGNDAEYGDVTSFWHDASGDPKGCKRQRVRFGIDGDKSGAELASVASEGTLARHRGGFPLMAPGLRRISVFAPTPIRALEYYDNIAKYIVREVATGRMALLDYNPFWPCRVSPFNAVEQPTKVRVVTNLSAPGGASVNAAMDPREIKRVRLPTLIMTSEDVLKLRAFWRARGLTDADWQRFVRIISFDVDNAYRNCARREVDEWLLGSALGDACVIDFGMSFGGADAVSHFQLDVSEPLARRIEEVLALEPAFEFDRAICDGGDVPLDIDDHESWREVITATNLEGLSSPLAKFVVERAKTRSGDIMMTDVKTTVRPYIDDLWSIVLGVTNQIWLLRTVWQVASACTIPGSRKKLRSGLSRGGAATLLGKTLDATLFRLTYPEKKMPRMIGILDEIMRRNFATDTQVMSWQGSIRDLCSVAPNLRPFLFDFGEILGEAAKAPAQRGKLYIRPRHAPMKHLRGFLKKWNGVSFMRELELPETLWTSDASGKWGLGLFVGALADDEGVLTTGGPEAIWAQLKWTAIELEFSAQIHVLEAIGVLAALECAGHKLRGRRVRALCDNESVVKAWRARRSRESRALNEIIILITLATARLNIDLTLDHITTERNVVSDDISRGRADSALSHVDPLVAARSTQVAIPERVIRAWRTSLYSVSRRSTTK